MFRIGRADDIPSVQGMTPTERFDATNLPALPGLGLDLARGRFVTILWATGFRRDFSWLNLPDVSERQFRCWPRGKDG